MREAIDYNALSWIRQEVGVTLKQARLELEEYAGGEQRKELLQGCAAYLHEARGPLQMVNIKGADMLACEMEEAIADLLLDTVIDRDTLLEQLMQGFLELPEYLSNLRTGKRENPRLLLPLINSLRASRGIQPLREDAVFSPDLSATMPAAEFDPQARHLELDVAAMARAARVRFQSGLLEWYRDSGTNHGLQILVEALEQLQTSAQSEQAARIWWVASGLAELLRDGTITTGPAVKRLFGQLDRQIKRLMDSGEAVFRDVLSEDLLKNLLSQLAGVETESPRVQLIRSTYGIARHDTSGSAAADDASDIGEELLQTVSATVGDDLDRIKESLDSLVRDPGAGADAFAAVADDLHSLGNTLGMIGMDRLGVRLADEEQQLRRLGDAEAAGVELDFSDLVTTLVAVEDALSNVAMHSGGTDAVDEQGNAVLKQGQQAVMAAVIADIATAKDTINEFLKTAGDFALLDQVPVHLNKISGGLELVNEDRLALAARRVGSFVSAELLGKQRELDDKELDNLADAICSIEYCVEELAENHKYGERAIKVATESLEKLGYSDAALYTRDATVTSPPEQVAFEMPGLLDAAEERHDGEYLQESPAEETGRDGQFSEQGLAKSAPAWTGNGHGYAQLQIVAPDADSEIVEIFIEEAGEVLDRLEVDIPAWIMNPEDHELLGEVRRAFHTIKGSGRMIGAMAAGELAWAFECLLNRVIEGAKHADAGVLDLVGKSIPALRELVAQVSNPDTVLLTDVDLLGRQAAELGQSGMRGTEVAASGAAADAVLHDIEHAEDSITIDEVDPALPETVEEGLDAAFDVIPEQVVPVYAESDAEQVPEMIAALPEDAAEDVSATNVIPDETGEVSGAVEPVVRESTTGIGVCCVANGGVEDLPVLKEGADQEIVGIFLEEAGEELESISLKIPEWIQQPEDTGLLDDIRRSLHTLKGSGRMVGAMATGEFAWSIEALLNRLIEGAISNSGSLAGLLAQVPQAVSSLLRQLQDGTVPDMDIGGLMRKAAELANPGTGAVHEEVGETGSAAVIEAAESQQAADEEGDDAVLMRLYSTECREHLGTLEDSMVNFVESGRVAETQYRALHTLSGISESASVPGIRRIAAALYSYFGELYQEDMPAPPEAAGVLADGVREMRMQLERLPDRNYDDEMVAELLVRVDSLPTVESTSEAGVMPSPDERESPAEREMQVAVEEEGIPELPAGAMPESAVSGHTEAEAGQEETLEHPDGVRSGRDESGLVDVAVTQAGTDVYSGMDQELYEIFVEEASEIIDSSEGVLRNWAEAPDDRDLLVDFQRLLHTLKGGARMVDLTAIGDLSHALESLLTQVADNVLPSNDALFSLLQESHDRLAEMFEKVKMRAVLEPAGDLEARLDAFRNGEEKLSVDEESAPETTTTESSGPDTATRVEESCDSLATVLETGGDAVSEPVDEDAGLAHAFDTVESDTGLMVQAVASQPTMVERRKEGRSRGELVRVQADVLDNLVNNAGEINIYRARMEQQISNFSFNLTELDQTISRLRDQLRQLEMETEAQILFRYEQESENRNQEFDPLELDRYSKLQQLSRSLIESISDLRSLQSLMQATARDSETLLLQQSRVSIDLQEGLIRTRMIPFAGLAPRLRRVVRQSARQLDKKVDLNLQGADGEMDRAVIERIVAPLEHMLRNAVAHGIETPDRRKDAGKHAVGSITIEFNREGTEIVLQISDDGAGLDIDAIRRRAIERGLMDADMELPDSDVMQFVLQTGFSTASEVTQIAGRGVGMDVVNSEVKQLGGSLHIDSVSGKGSVFTVRLPYTLAINQALLITVGEQIFCVPMSSIEGVVTAGTDQLKACYRDNRQDFAYAGHNYQLMHLGSLLGISRMDLENAGTQVPVLLVRAGDKRIGMQVDSLLGNREVVIKPLGAQLSMVDGITGATILGDGRVVMILDMFAVSRMKVREQTAARTEMANEDGRLVVMVVDDSITVRKVTSRLLERSGYRVMTAKDGVDAMGQLQDVVPDMMLLDIEMPRMDGFELATHMRNDERLRHVPIIMITSRTGDKHRDRAFEIGVNEYLGKPYQESELLASINNIIGIDTNAVRA